VDRGTLAHVLWLLESTIPAARVGRDEGPDLFCRGIAGPIVHHDDLFLHAVIEVDRLHALKDVGDRSAPRCRRGMLTESFRGVVIGNRAKVEYPHLMVGAPTDSGEKGAQCTDAASISLLFMIK
jgi:hypothetical protein